MPRSFSFVAMFMLQFVNPKAWILILTLTATSSRSVAGLAALVLTISAVSLVCLSLWATIGRIIGAMLHRSAARYWVDRLLGASLMGLAVLTFAQV